jgi:hypothetical protein
LQHQAKELSTKQSTGSGAALLVRINEIEAALEALQKSNRRELGKLWKLVGEPPAPKAPNGHLPLEEYDDDLAAELALQLAPPARPGA